MQRIYPAVQFPVSRATSMIAPLVRWEHGDDWFVTKFELQRSTRSGERKVQISLNDQDYDFIVGHTIDGNLFKKKIFQKNLKKNCNLPHDSLKTNHFSLFRACFISSNGIFAISLGNIGHDERSNFLRYECSI